MMTPEQLKNSILQRAIEGKLVPQIESEGTGAELLEKIKTPQPQQVAAAPLTGGKKSAKSKQKTSQLGEVANEVSQRGFPFAIPKTWAWCRLGEIGETNIGLTYSPKDISNKGTIVLRSNNIQESKLNFDEVVLVSMNIPETKMCKIGDILICARNGSKRLVGKSALIDREGLSFGAFMALYRSVCNSYVFFVVISRYFRDSLLGDVGTTTINQITQEMLKNLFIPLPPLAEQKRIVAKLEELLPLVDEYAEAYHKLQTLNSKFPLNLKKSLLQYAMEGKLVPQIESEGTGAELLAEIRKEKIKQTKEGKLKKQKELATITDEEEPFTIPKTWAWCRFGEIVNYNMGKTPPRAEIEWWGKDFPWVSIADMPENGHIGSTKEKVTNRALTEKFSNKISKAGTLLMSFKLTVGRVSILDIDAVHNEAIISIYPFADSGGITKNFLFYFLPFLTTLGETKDAIKGRTLNDTSIRNLFIPLPPLAEQKRIVAKLEELLPLCEEIG